MLKIVLSGANAPSGSSGLGLGANSITIRGLVIGRGFLDGIAAGLVSDLKVIGCFIGVDTTGNTAFPNIRNGIYFASRTASRSAARHPPTAT